MSKIESGFGECPVQARGTVEGRAFYFRARHNSWSFAPYEDSSVSLEMAMDMDEANADFYLEGDYGQTEHEAGYMPPCDVEQLIEQGAAKYQACPRRPRCSCRLTERSSAVRRGTVLRGGRKVEVYCYEWIAEPNSQC